MVPANNAHSINIYWHLPPVKKHYDKKPLSLLSHILGYEGKGSLFLFLRDQGYATGLSASTYKSFQDWSLFKLTVKLTETGLKNVDEIVKLTYQYILEIQEADAKTLTE